MKAVVCPKYGGPEVLEITEIPKPLPKANELLIRVVASSISAADYRVRGFDVPAAAWLPARVILGVRKLRQPVLGAEISGIVESVGAATSRFKVGDEVIASCLPYFGGYAEYIILPESDSITLKPRSITWQQAAVTPIGAITAYHFLKLGKISSGQKILIYGASGSVGTYTTQIARHVGARVTAVCRKENHQMMMSLGAEKVIDYQDENWQNQLEKYDMFFVAIDQCPFQIANGALKKDGTYINIANPMKSPKMYWVTTLSAKRVIMAGNFKVSREAFQHVLDLVDLGVIIPIIDKTYTLDTIIEGHQYVNERHKRGNVALEVWEAGLSNEK